MHNVHFNQKYRSLTESLNHEDGILVIASMFKVSPNDNAQLQPLIQMLSQVQPVKSSIRYKGDVTLGKLIPLFDSFYNYGGSLTTPPCSVAVSWIILSDFGEVSYRQLNAFRSLLTHDHTGKSKRLGSNVRDIQETGDRKITKSQLVARQDIDLSSNNISAGKSLNIVPMATKLIITFTITGILLFFK